nr:MAG TPA: hypothetical protein [Bacteriophage sp.]
MHNLPQLTAAGFYRSVADLFSIIHVFSFE